VVVISESLARQKFPGVDPIGQRLRVGPNDGPWSTIVGVVGDVRHASPAAAPGPELSMPRRQHPYAASRVQVVVRTSVDPESLIGTVRGAVQAASPEVALKFTTLQASVEGSVAAPRFRMALVSAFASLALLLAVAGIYAVMSYGTSQRTSEFGLRVALGAKAPDVARLVVGGAARLVAVGLALGLLLAAATGRVITSMLFGIRPMDAAAYGAVVLLSVPMIVVAALVPALRAARVDPMTALREP
jgi:predicted lysophospholipase L1 biosynthesis ABC-type transport system permease subunit